MFNQNNECMKRLSLILFSVAIAVSGFFTSCTEDTDTTFDKPTIDVVLGGQAVSGTVEKAEGTALNFEIKFSMGAAEDKLTKIRITSTIGGKTFNVIDSVLDAGLFNGGDKEFVYTYNTSVGTSEEKLSFYTEDSKSRTQEEVITIKPTSVTPAGSVRTTETIIMGSYKNTQYNSCYSLSLNKTVSLQGGFSQPDPIDILYFYGSENQATLAGPSNAALATVYNNATYGIAKWSKRNATKLLTTTVTSATFDAINTSALFTASFPTDLTAATDMANKLITNKVVAMETVGGKKALIKVTEINGNTSTSYIKITVKTVL